MKLDLVEKINSEAFINTNQALLGSNGDNIEDSVAAKIWEKLPETMQHEKLLNGQISAFQHLLPKLLTGDYVEFFLSSYALGITHGISFAQFEIDQEELKKIYA